MVIGEAGDNKADFERLLTMDEQWPDHFEERRRPRATASTKKETASTTPWPTWWPGRSRCKIISTISWAISIFDRKFGQMADRIIYNLNVNGYLQGTLEDLLGPEAGADDMALAREALAVVQRLDPPGVAARDLKECLLLQLLPGMPYYEQIRTLVRDHLEDLEHNRLPVVARQTGYAMELIQRTIQELRKLNPKPAADFSSASAPPVTPDVFVEPAEAGGYRMHWKTAAPPACSSAPITASFWPPATPTRKPRNTSSGRSMPPSGLSTRSSNAAIRLPRWPKPSWTIRTSSSARGRSISSP